MERADGLHLGKTVGGKACLSLCACEYSYWCQHVCWRVCVQVGAAARSWLWPWSKVCVCVCVCGLVSGRISCDHCCASFFWGPDGDEAGCSTWLFLTSSLTNKGRNGGRIRQNLWKKCLLRSLFKLRWPINFVKIFHLITFFSDEN